MMQIEMFEKCFYMIDNNKYWMEIVRSMLLAGLAIRVQNPDSTVFPDCPVFVECVGTPQQIAQFENLRQDMKGVRKV